MFVQSYLFTDTRKLNKCDIIYICKNLVEEEFSKNSWELNIRYRWLISKDVTDSLDIDNNDCPLSLFNIPIKIDNQRCRSIVLEKRHMIIKDIITHEYCKSDANTITSYYETHKTIMGGSIKKVIFNDPATIVYWIDGTKTVVKADEERFDSEKGLAMAIAKKYFGNKGDYYDVFRKWLPKEEDFGKFTNTPIPEEDEILTATQLAEKTGQSEVTIRRDCRRGLHPGAIKVDGKWLIPYSGLVGGGTMDGD